MSRFFSSKDRAPHLGPYPVELLGRCDVTVPVTKSIAEVLNDNGVPVDMKCSDGICGVCKCGLISGEVEHRDYVLSRTQRKTDIILCQSRAANKGGVIEIDL